MMHEPPERFEPEHNPYVPHEALDSLFDSIKDLHNIATRHFWFGVKFGIFTFVWIVFCLLLQNILIAGIFGTVFVLMTAHSIRRSLQWKQEAFDQLAILNKHRKSYGLEPVGFE